MPHDPSPRRPGPHRDRRAPGRGRWLPRALGLLLVAVVVLGIGSAATPGFPGFPGHNTAPAIAADPALARVAQLRTQAVLLAARGPAPAAGLPAAGSGTVAGTTPDGWPGAELAYAATVLRDHVGFLTPGTPGGVPAPTVPADADPAAFAQSLAASGNTLLERALAAPRHEVRALLTAGLEQAVAARRLSAATEATAADARTAGPAAATASTPRVPAGLWTEVSAAVRDDAVCGAESVAPGAAGGGRGRNAGRGAGAGRDRDASTADSLRAAADAAFRLSYAYQVAGARIGGSGAAPAWAAAADREKLGQRLQSMVPEDCAATRRAAYVLPRGFDAAPLARAASGEAQLAAALRDAAATVDGDARRVLAAEAWTAALAAEERAGGLARLS